MAQNIKSIEGKPKAIGKRVLVKNMNFGEQVTRSGIILTSDNGKAHGVHPRWGQVYSKGARNTDPYQEGDWILVEHGRWTRGITVDDSNEETVIRMVDVEGIIGWSDEEPEGVILGD